MATPLQRRRRDGGCAPRTGPPPYVAQGTERRNYGADVQRGVAFSGAPRPWRGSRLLVDTDLPDAGPTTAPTIFARAQVAKGEVWHLVAWGQRLVLRRPGRAESARGDPRCFLSGTGLTVTWHLTKRDNVDGHIAAGTALVPESGSTQIASPWAAPRREHVLVVGPTFVEFAAVLSGTTKVRDHIFELGGYLEAWRYEEGGIPSELLWLGMQTAG